MSTTPTGSATPATPGVGRAVPRRAAPDHLVLADQPRHGVTILARQLAAATGARTVTTDQVAPGHGTAGPAHLHFCDRLLGDTPGAAAEEVERLARLGPLTVTLHDVPAAADGPGFAARADAYRRVLAVAEGWVACSRTELEQVGRVLAPDRAGAVVPLPLVEPGRRRVAGPVDAGRATVGVLGWIYPGKGHLEALHAAAGLGRRRDERPTVVALGSPAPGHDALVAELHALAARLDVGLEVTGWLADDDLAARAAACDVGVAGHRNVSASGSVNSWIAAGHVPLVRDSPYAREMAALRPGTLTRYRDDEHAPADTDLGTGPGVPTLGRALADRLRHPVALPGTPLAWTLGDVARAYERWWQS